MQVANKLNVAMIYICYRNAAKLSQMPESRKPWLVSPFHNNGDNKASKTGKQYGSK